MRDYINKHKTVQDPNYCVRVTSDEGKIGRSFLEQFQDNEKTIPTIITSSQMLTTGVDAKNIRNLVLDRTIGSMVEFKQIVGRGTRTFEGKDHFTILDFRGATNKFYDADWDGDPQVPTEETTADDITTPTHAAEETHNPFETTPTQPEDKSNNPTENKETEKPKQLVVKLSNNREIKVIDVEMRYIDETGRPLSLAEFIDKLAEQLPNLFTDQADLTQKWSNPDSRDELMQQITSLGFDQEQIATLRKIFDAEKTDLYDLISYLAYEKPMITRETRANKVRQNNDFFNLYKNDQAQNFLKFVLSSYEETGSLELSRSHLPTLINLSGLGTLKDATAAFDNKPERLLTAFTDLQKHLYN